FLKGHGYPLFNPQPSDDLRGIARTGGVQIGDIGVLTPDGSFDPLFNITFPSDHPANSRFGVPQDFVPVMLAERDIVIREQYDRLGSIISNVSIAKQRLDMLTSLIFADRFSPVGAGATVELSTSSSATAILILPDGASSMNLRALQKFRECALKHAQIWYELVNKDLGHMVRNGDLVLVTGVTKSASW
ncbi:hypothetical protein B0H16DRAFT_1263523, partial [Mycena metata]